MVLAQVHEVFMGGLARGELPKGTLRRVLIAADHASILVDVFAK